MGVINLPNILTITRILIIPFFVTSLIYGHYRYSLCLFIGAAITDTLDGLLARLKDQKTTFGTILDPVADKFLLATSFIFFSIYHWVPTWLTIMVISRDIIITIGWFILYLSTHTARVEPSIFGKASNIFQVILLAFVLLSINIRGTAYVPSILVWPVVLLTALSGLHYIYRGFRTASG